MAAQSKRAENAINAGLPPRHTGSFQRRLRKKHHSSQREITWANTEEKRSRQFAVTNLYPRLLYTFSDVVVFVLKNARYGPALNTAYKNPTKSRRTIEGVVEQLITWAQAALEKSTNQPVLPHLIIALNATENSIEPQQWEVDFATERLMRTVTEAMFTKPSFKGYIAYWHERRRNIRNAQDLLCSYYSSVRVVRIPAKGRPQLISEQLGKLYDQILNDCRQSHQGRRRMRMLLDADELQNYLQYAFDHFAGDLDMPFDFVKACLLHNPIPRDFGGNILKLAINVMEVWPDKLDGAGIFDELSLMIASCIMLDAARHKTPGTLHDTCEDTAENSQVLLRVYFGSIIWNTVMTRLRIFAIDTGHAKRVVRQEDAPMSKVVIALKDINFRPERPLGRANINQAFLRNHTATCGKA